MRPQFFSLATNFSHFSLKYFCWQLNLKTYGPAGPKVFPESQALRGSRYGPLLLPSDGAAPSQLFSLSLTESAV